MFGITGLKTLGLIIALTVLNQQVGLARPQHELEFFRRHEGVYQWQPDLFATLEAIAPDGTRAFAGNPVSYTSFEEFLNGVVGQWTVMDFVGNQSTFVISTFSEDLFCNAELNSPKDAQNIISGVPFTYQVNASEDTEIDGIEIRGSFAELDIDFLPGRGLVLTLKPGFNVAFARLHPLCGHRHSGLVSEIDMQDSSVEISERILFFDVGPSSEVRVTRSPIVGDVNRDGAVDLFDVSPFVNVITSGEFQIEADIDGNGEVDLLDINPFVDLIN